MPEKARDGSGLPQNVFTNLALTLRAIARPSFELCLLSRCSLPASLIKSSTAPEIELTKLAIVVRGRLGADASALT